jgi:diacylglycerol kinase (ATP)
MRLSLIHNPKSGDDDHAGEQLVELLAKAGHEVSYFRSKGPWQAAIDERPDLLVIAGGDGTVGEVARAIAGRPVPMTILPIGTANNIAGWLGLSGIPLEELVAGWPGGFVQPFDCGVARGPWGTSRFLESVGVGLLAHLMSEIDAGESGYVNQLNGRETRITAAREVLERVLGRSNPFRTDIRLDGVDLSSEYLLVEVLNFGAAGPNLQLAPDADGADGMLDVVLVEAHERDWLAQHLSAIGSDPLNAPSLRVHHARHVTIRCERCMVHLDDELWPEHAADPSLIVEASVEPGVLTFLVPPIAARRGAVEGLTASGRPAVKGPRHIRRAPLTRLEDRGPARSDGFLLVSGRLRVFNR